MEEVVRLLVMVEEGLGRSLGKSSPAMVAGGGWSGGGRMEASASPGEEGGEVK